MTRQEALDEYQSSGRRRKFTRDDMIYGVFNDSDSDNDERKPAKKDYSKPVAFVSGGVAGKARHKHGSDSEAGSGDEDDDGIADDEEVLRREFGLDGPLGGDDEAAHKRQAKDADDSDHDAEDDKPAGRSARTFKPGVVRDKQARAAASNPDPFASTATKKPAVPSLANQEFARKLLSKQAAAPSSDSPEPDSKARAFGGQGDAQAKTKKVGYSLFQNDGNKKLDKDFAKFEAHTKGIGMKLLMKMGFKPGQGLGPQNQGIAAPIEVVVREKGRGLQEKGERTKQSKEDFASKEVDSDEEFNEQLDQWRVAAGSSKAKKPKYRYIQPGSTTTDSPGALNIIDMTGPAARVIKDAGSMRSMPIFSAIDASLPMPELQHNIKVLVDVAHDDLRQRTKQLHAERDKVEHLTIEKEKVTRQMQGQRTHSDRLREILGILDECRNRMDSNELELPQFMQIFIHLQTKFFDEYRLYGLANLAIAIAFPMIEKHLAAWDVLAAPLEPVHMFKSWRTLLEDGNARNNIFEESSGGTENMTLYEQLCWNVLLPKFRSVVTSAWNPRQFEPVLTFVEGWSTMLPKWIYDNVVQQLLFPRLQAEVELWNPREDTVPIHAWLHPWLPVLDKRLDALYPQIRYKLGYCLQAWHPSDSSARAMLLPWKTVFSASDMAAFIARFISPKLTLCMRELVLNPANQIMTNWNHVFAWRELMPTSDLVQILEQQFFPKFFTVLCEWLSAPDANFVEVSQWYSYWRGMFDKDLLSNVAIKTHLKRALDLMNRAVLGPDAPPVDDARTFSPAPVTTPAGPVLSSAADGRFSAFASDKSIDLKHLVQKLADENNILYLPKPGRTAEGKTLYNFGKALIYIEREVLYARDKSTGFYIPVSLDDLLKLA